MELETRTPKLKTRITPVMTGIAIGILAAAVQWLFDKPEAYGVCVACHSRDMLGWIFNNLLSSSLIDVTEVGFFSPFLTPLGILIGAHVAARRNNVFPKSASGRYVRMFIMGFLVMISALLLAACPLRLLLRIAYGDPLALFGGVWMVAGIFIGIHVLRRWG